MNFKQINQAYDLMKEVEALDYEIIKIESFAILASKGFEEGHVSITVPKPKEEEKKPDIFGEYGFIKPEFLGEEKPKEDVPRAGYVTGWLNEYMIDAMRSFQTGGRMKKAPEKETIDFNSALPDHVIIRIVAIVIRELKQKRSLKLKQIDKLWKLENE